MVNTMVSACRDAAHGVDEREVEAMKTRRSVGAEVNWGIRFTCQADAETFLDGLAGALPCSSLLLIVSASSHLVWHNLESCNPGGSQLHGLCGSQAENGLNIWLKVLTECQPRQ